MLNIPPNSIIVIDNTPYYNFQLNQAPHFNSLKGDMVKWLRERNITFTDTMLKPELYELIKLYKPQYKIYKIDTILAEQRHSSLLKNHRNDLDYIERKGSQTKCIIFNYG